MTADVEAGTAAFARQCWGEACAHLGRAARSGDLDAAGFERLAVAAHCTAQHDVSTDAWARAYSAHLEAGDADRAAAAACWCSFALVIRGEVALSNGWLGRAQELCEQHRLDCPAVGFIKGQTAARAMFAGDLEAAIQGFQEARAYALRFHDVDGLALDRLGRGQCLVQLGRAAEGLGLFDEVMVALTTDDVSPLVAGLAYCAGIECSRRSLDLRRAKEWTAALTRWCGSQPDLVPFRGDCLTHRAEILLLLGAWAEASEEADRARDLLAEVGGPALGGACYVLGEVHRLRGEHAEAEAAYRQASQHGHEPQPGLGLLRLAQGHSGSATAAVQRALAEAAHPRARAELLDALVEIALATPDLPTAETAAGELAALRADIEVPLLMAQAERAAGAVALARGDARGALVPLRAAVRAWQEVSAPYEGARTRVLMARACLAVGDEDGAQLELDAARWVFAELGAEPDVRRLDALAQRTPAPAPGGLSVRELEVLRLVAAGKTNRSIAEELFLSEKTVHRHLSNIFAKLDVGSRSAATAFAFQHSLV